jgi:hypothetical protein
MTVEALKRYFEDNFKLDVSMITFGSATIYTSFDQGSKKRLHMIVPEAIEALTKKEIPKYKRFLALGVSGNDKEGADCLLPDIRYEI